MKKRIIAVLLAAMMAASLGGCGKEENKNSGKKNEDGTFDDVKLKMLVCWNGGFKTPKDQYNNDVAKAIREKTGVTVEFEGIMMSETEKLNLMFASGDMPDMINAPYWGGSAGETEVIKKAANEGRLLDIKDEVAKYENLKGAFDVGVVSQNYLENDLTFEDGARYVLPQEVPDGTIESITNWAYGIFVRGDVPEALGIDPESIKTTDQLYDFMKKAKDYGFKDVNGNATITYTTYHEGWDYGQAQMNFNKKQTTSYTIEEDGTVTYDPLSENWIEKNIFIWKLVNEGILDKECFKCTDAQADEKVGNGTALFASAQYGTIINSTKLTGLYNSNPEMRYTWVGPLTYKDGTPLAQPETQGRTGSPGIIFPTTCSNLDAALTWLNYLNSEEGARLAQYGFEGDTYELNEQGQPRMNAELTKRYQEDAESVNQELRERGINFMMGRTLLADKRMSWWGEKGAFEADAEDPYVKEYKTLRKVEVLEGYPVKELAPGFEKYDEVAEFAFQGTTEKDYRERAYFASTEKEARKILEDYQNYLLTQKDGLFNEFLDYMADAVVEKEKEGVKVID